jgi:hypothetical protein
MSCTGSQPAIAAFGNVYTHGSQPKAPVGASQKANHFGCGTQENCFCSTGAVGKDQGNEKVVPISARKGRTMSPAARKRMVAAQKVRWMKHEFTLLGTPPYLPC